MTNTKYKIVDVTLSDDGELIVGFDCSSKDIDPIKKAMSFSYNATEDEVLDAINDLAHTVIETAETDKTNKQSNEIKKNDRKATAKPLKDSISKDIGKEKPVKKPEKK